VVGRHRQNWEPIAACRAMWPVNEWIKLTVRTTAKSFEVLVNGKSMMPIRGHRASAENRRGGLRIWQHKVLCSANLSVCHRCESQQKGAFEYDSGDSPADSVKRHVAPDPAGQWSMGSCHPESDGAFSAIKKPSEITFASGSRGWVINPSRLIPMSPDNRWA